MADQQRQLSRFGFSWFSALRGAPQPQTSRPNKSPAAVQRPSVHKKAPTKLPTFLNEAKKSETSAVRASAEKAPLQPPTSESQAQPKNETPEGKTQAQPSPSQSRAMQKTETQTPLASPASQSRGMSEPSSESCPDAQPQASSVPSSPRQNASHSQQLTWDGQSPPRLASEPSGQIEAPASSLLYPTTGQPMQTGEAVTETPSPSKTAKSPTNESSKTPAGSAQPSKATLQEGTKTAVSQALSQEAKPTAKTESEEEGNPLVFQMPSQELTPFKVEPANTSTTKEEVNTLASQKPASEPKAEPGSTSRKQEEGIPSVSRREIMEDISKYVPEKALGNSTKLLKDEKPVSAITVAVDNRVATMHLDLSSGKDGSISIREHTAEDGPKATADGGHSGGRKSKDLDDKEEDSLSNACINSNIQSINNSLLLSCSVSERNPGVHIVLSSKPCARSENIKPCASQG